jgi:hypothetical protein
MQTLWDLNPTIRLYGVLDSFRRRYCDSGDPVSDWTDMIEPCHYKGRFRYQETSDCYHCIKMRLINHHWKRYDGDIRLVDDKKRQYEELIVTFNNHIDCHLRIVICPDDESSWNKGKGQFRIEAYRDDVEVDMYLFRDTFEAIAYVEGFLAALDCTKGITTRKKMDKEFRDLGVKKLADN